MHTCLNCRSPLHDAFCCKCGQKADTHRFTVPHVLHEIPHSLFHLDKGIFRNIRSITYPRQAVQEYLAGRRKVYFNPLLFFFLTLGLLLFLAPLLHVETTLVVRLPLFDIEGYNSGRWINHFSKFLYVGCAFLFAWPNYYLFRKETGYNYAEHVVAGLFMLGYVNLVCLLLLPTPFIATVPVNLVTGVSLLLFLFLIFYRGKWWLTLLKSVVAVCLYLVLFLAALLLVAFCGYLVLRATH